VTRAAVYCRISLSRFGDTAKVDDQEKVSRKLAADRGWAVADEHVYKDNSRSAWQRNRRRPGWDALLKAVEDGQVDAIVVYHGDRLIRQPWDLEVLLRLADDRGIRLASVVGDRDLGNTDDRYILRIEAAGACRESDSTSRRQKAHHARRAEQGLHRPGGRGGRAFGFETDGFTHRPDEVAIIRECATRILQGSEVGAICRDLTTRGVKTSAGNNFDHGALKKLLMRPRMAGLFVHHGEIVGEAAWDPVLDRVTWVALCFELNDRAGKYHYTTNSRRYLLTNIATCGPCGAGLVIRHNTRSETLRGYGCINPACKSKVHRSVRHLDLYVTEYVLALLSGVDVSELVGELAAVEGRRRQTIEAFADDDSMSPDVLQLSVARFDKRIAELRARIDAANSTHAIAGIAGITAAEWESLPLERRRAAVRALVSVTVHKSSRRGPGFDASTVVVSRRVAGQ
jgi:site-specific DNA recombinase